EMLDILDRVSRLRDTNRFAHDLVEVDKLAATQKVVEFGFSRAVQAHQPLQMGRLIVGIVIDMRLRVASKPPDGEVHELFEGAPLLISRVGPKRAELWLPVLEVVHAEKILEAV